MAYYIDRPFTTFQGRAQRSATRDRLPMATLVLGLIAALAIAGGALNRFPVAQAPLMDELTDIEFLTGDVTPH